MGLPHEEEDTEFLEPGEEGWPVREEASSFAGPAPVEAPAPPARRSRLSVLPWLTITLLLVALAAAGGGAAVAMFGRGGGESPATVEAAAATPSKPHAKKPSPSTTTSATSTSTTTDGVDVPDLAGVTQAKATSALAARGLKAKVQLVLSDGPPGRVLRQSPSAGAAPDGSTIVLSVSRAKPNPPTVVVPDVVGLSTASAESALRTRDLAFELRQVPSNLELGRVVSQWPSAGGQVAKGRTVLLNVSQSRPLESVPGVVGDDQGSARGELSGAGFTVSVQTRAVTNLEKDGVVVAQSPSPGAKRKHGATVTITVGDYSSA